MKTATINKTFWPILESMGHSDIVNAYFGGSNLFAEYRNDYTENPNAFLADWIEDNVNKPHWKDVDVDLVDLLDNPDNLLRESAYAFFRALAWLVDDNDRAEWLLRNAKFHLEPWGSFYVFSNADIACTFIIRAENVAEAYNELTTRFEDSFSIEDEEDVDEDTERNDNGTPINTDYLVMVGEIKSA